MAYGHAERNLVLIRQLEAETRRFLASLDQPDAEQSAFLQDGAGGAATGTAAHPADLAEGVNIHVDEMTRELPAGSWSRFRRQTSSSSSPSSSIRASTPCNAD
jgi:hypothetical protein